MKVKEITPKAFSCEAGGCPAVFETDKGTCLIIGKMVDSAKNPLSGRIGPNEVVIEVPVELIKGIRTK